MAIIMVPHALTPPAVTGLFHHRRKTRFASLSCNDTRASSSSSSSSNSLILWAPTSRTRHLRHSPTRFKAAPEEQSETSGEEPPESLFTKELKRRGITPASLLGDNETTAREEGNSDKVRRKTGIFTRIDEGNQVDQREISMTMNSEGLEGLIPRAKVLLTLGGSFIVGFWPFMLAIVAFFSAIYIYFGPSFIHAGNKQMAQPTYTDPNKLLEDEAFS